MDLAESADELYGPGVAGLADFARLRGELAAAARAAGDRPLAEAIGKLRKPVLAAALVNGLVRSQPRALDELAEVASALREAQRQLRGAELRELSGRRQRVLARLTALASQASPRPVAAGVLDQLRATFEAAIADEAAEQAVRSGRLTAALSYSGFGEVDLDEAVAVPEPTAARSTVAGPGRLDSAAQRALATAVATEQAAAGELAAVSERSNELAGLAEASRSRLLAAKAALAEAERTAARARTAFAEAEQAAAAAAREAAEAARRRDAAERSHQRAQRRRASAERISPSEPCPERAGAERTSPERARRP